MQNPSFMLGNWDQLNHGYQYLEYCTSTNNPYTNSYLSIEEPRLFLKNFFDCYLYNVVLLKS